MSYICNLMKREHYLSSIIFIVVISAIYNFVKPRYYRPRVFQKVFDENTCATIINIAKNRLDKSEVEFDYDTDGVDEKVRKSETAWLDPTDIDPKDNKLIRHVIDKCLKLSNIKKSVSCCEDLQVLKYKPGGFYLPHFDTSDIENEPNPRVMTCIIALNDKYSGGSTNFPYLHMSYKLNAGDVLIFNTLDTWGLESEKALHQGTDVIEGDKWIANLWIHKFPYED